MPDPLFTIGIPTFNRAGFLRQSLQAAVNQTYGNIQILVCDNGSTDETAATVEQFRDSRIDYRRSDSNIGPQRNFARAVDLAQGHYFSWLQDDDLISTSFVSRAVEVLTEYQAGSYLGTAVYSPTVEVFHNPPLYSPPIKLDWMRGVPSLVGPDTVIGLSCLVSVAIPPVVAFQTELLRSQVKTLSGSNFPLFLERTILCEAALAAPVVADPRVCGIFRQHAEQASVGWCADSKRYRAEWICMAEFLESLESAVASSELLQLKECFCGVAASTLRSWVAKSVLWPTDYKVAGRIRQLLLDSAKDRGLGDEPVRQRRLSLKHCAKQMIPPVFYPLLRKLKGRD